ncbi:MAG: hypothetical protein ACOC34_04345 [Thermotogota bacterium]
MKRWCAIAAILLITGTVFTAYINNHIIDHWAHYGMAYYTYEDNNNTVFKTMYHYQPWGPTMNFYYVPAMNNITLEQPSPPSLRRNSEKELIIIFWLYRQGIFSLQDHVLDAYSRITAKGTKGTAGFETPYSIMRLDCQNDKDVFYISLTEYPK